MINLKNYAVPSKVIAEMHYDPATFTLRIVFVTGRIYEYQNVPEKIFRELKASSSKGVYLNQFIKPAYTYKKLN